MAEKAPRSLRLHVGIFGRRNVGKSSLLNAITRQNVSIVSDVAGTTTDPVEKPMEFLPLGPVLFIDTAGVDDAGALGALRVGRTERVFDRTDLSVVVAEAAAWGPFEESLLREMRKRSIPVVVVFNKSDLGPPPTEVVARLDAEGVRHVRTNARDSGGILEFRQALLDAAPQDWLERRPILADLVGPGEMAVLVVPIDKEAPKGRIILPQVQTIRDLLDGGSWCTVVRDTELGESLARLARPPRIVVTDSQAFDRVAADTPPEVPLTSFSILFARYRGDLAEQARGARAVDELRPGDRVLIAEACSHHPIGEDIGRVKIPRWLQEFVGGPLAFRTVQGHDFPDDLSPYRLVIHCGACMINRREALTRILRCKAAGVPVTNYGLVIARSLGILERALQPFPEALDIVRGAPGREPRPVDA